MNNKAMNHKIHPGIFIIVSALSSFLLAGCTHVTHPPAQPFMAYVGQEKIHLKIGINITDELLAAKGETHSFVKDNWVIPIGGSIADNARVLARQTFDEVTDMSNGQLPLNKTVAATLTPKVAYVNRTVGVTSFGESIVDIKVEWTFSDLKGNTIWVDTIDGQGRGPTGTAFSVTGKAEKYLKMALEDLLVKSQQAIATAPAIREFARKQ